MDLPMATLAECEVVWLVASDRGRVPEGPYGGEDSQATRMLRPNPRKSLHLPRDCFLVSYGDFVAPDATDRPFSALANEGNVTSMANLWVAAAINTEMDDPVFDESTDDEGQQDGQQELTGAEDNGSVFYGEEETSRPVTPAASGGRVARLSNRPSFGSSVAAPRPRPSFGGFAFGPLTQISAPSPLRPQQDLSPSQNQTPRVPISQLGTPHIGYRRGSSTSNLGLPAIYNNTGLSSPPALAQDLQPYFDDDRAHGHAPHLSVISEGSGSMTDVPSLAAASQSGQTAVVELPPTPSVWGQLPLIIIFQYGLLALHNVCGYPRLRHSSDPSVNRPFMTSTFFHTWFRKPYHHGPLS